MKQLVDAFEVALPEIRVLQIGEKVEGYANDRWIVHTDDGPLLVKVRRRFPDGRDQIEGQVRAQHWLARTTFPTPELLHLEWECPELDNRQFAVQRYLDAEPSDNVVATLSRAQHAQFFADFGRAVGLMHSFDIPEAIDWVDDSGDIQHTWPDTIRPSAAIRTIFDHGRIFPLDALSAVEEQIERGLAALPEVCPRLVHRDLHLDNTLASDDRFAAVIDLEMVREWDFAWDFATRLDGVFDCYDDSKGPFMAGYREVAGELPASFALRDWLYTGIYETLCIEEYLEGNQAYEASPRELLAWLETPMPA